MTDSPGSVTLDWTSGRRSSVGSLILGGPPFFFCKIEKGGSWSRQRHPRRWKDQFDSRERNGRDTGGEDTVHPFRRPRSTRTYWASDGQGTRNGSDVIRSWGWGERVVFLPLSVIRSTRVSFARSLIRSTDGTGNLREDRFSGTWGYTSAVLRALRVRPRSLSVGCGGLWSQRLEVSGMDCWGLVWPDLDRESSSASKDGSTPNANRRNTRPQGGTNLPSTSLSVREADPLGQGQTV